MKLTPTDILNLRKALLAARYAGVDDVVITGGRIAGVHEGHISAIFSMVMLSIDPEITMGIKKLTDFEKRLNLFGEDVLVEGELSDAKKVRKLSMRGKAGKIEYRCTDEKLITYPKTNPGDELMGITLTKPEIALLVKGTKTLGADGLVLQVKRDGTVHIECTDTNRDRFEIDIGSPALFSGDPQPYVNTLNVTNNGVFLQLLEQMVKDNDEAELVVFGTKIGMKVFGHDVFVIPDAQHGD